MHAPLPDEQLRAGHLPADLYRRLPPGASVVVVQAQPRTHYVRASPLGLLAIVCGTVGVSVLLLMIGHIIMAVAPLLGLGVTVQLTKSK